MALLAASRGHLEASFAWLGVALIIDGADGFFARRYRVAEVLPRFSGEDLDHVVDYLNYVMVPAFIVAIGDAVPSGLIIAAAVLIIMTSLYHFADKHSKSADGQYFIGFPAIWNVLIFALYVLAPGPQLAFCIIAVCAGLTFVPVRWVHPLRLRRARIYTIIASIALTAASVSVLSHGFPGDVFEKSIVVCSGIYFAMLGISPIFERSTV